MSENSITDIFSSLISEIRKLEKSRRLSIKQDELVKNAIQWLKDHQHPDGYWGYESVADTGLVLLAFSIYGVKDKEWTIKGNHKGGIQKSVNWLKNIRNVDNWENNLWDTSICLQALIKLGIREEWVFRVMEWVRKESREKAEKYEIHHLAQAANALLEAGLDEDAKNVSKTIALRMDERIKAKKEGEYPFEIYVTGQVLDTLVRSRFDLTSEVMKVAEANTMEFLQRIARKGISEATFQDLTMAFMGLASFLGGEDNALINSVTAEIFKMPERYKRDGSWYHDAKKTAFALIGLSKIKDIRKIDEFPARIYKIIMHYQEKAKEIYKNLESENEKRISKIKQGYLWLSLAYCSIIASLIIVITFGTDTFISQLIIGSLLIPVFLTMAVKAYRSFKGKVKERGGKYNER